MRVLLFKYDRLTLLNVEMAKNEVPFKAQSRLDIGSHYCILKLDPPVTASLASHIHPKPTRSKLAAAMNC